MQTYPTLGTNRAKFVFVSQGLISVELIPDLARKIIAFVGMTEARPGRIDDYPYLIDGRETGGHGYTGFFPLVESWLMWDDYYDLDNGGETEITISTCKPERLDPIAVCALLGKEIGHTDYLGSIGKGGPG